MPAINVDQALQLALTFRNTGQRAAAESLYRQVLSVLPAHPEALDGLGLLHIEMNRAAEAVHLLQQALAQAPRQARYHLDLAKAYQQLGQTDEARASRRRARNLEASPTGGATSSRRRLLYGGLPDEGFGWGVCNRQLVRALSARLDMETLGPVQNLTECFEGPVLMPLIDEALRPFSPVRGRRNFGYVFFESALLPNAISHAARYDGIFCGSSWCRQRLRESGIDHGTLLVQGVDHGVFHPPSEPTTPSVGTLRIFSGGKFEFRKGHDIVIAAFRQLLDIHPRARLVCAWRNYLPATIGSMKQSPHVRLPEGHFDTQEDFFHALLRQNGIPGENFEIIPALSQPALADIMRSTDLGVFPNRCEGGTNLVLMEYLACGRPVVASGATGHADVLQPDYAVLTPPHLTRQFWDEPKVAEITAGMTQILEDPARRLKLGAAASEAMLPWTWDRAAQTIVETIFPAGD
jgi:glycosyltransferase involved in cell wall biosynthesis